MSADQVRCLGPCPCRDCEKTRAAIVEAVAECRQMLAGVVSGVSSRD